MSAHPDRAGGWTADLLLVVVLVLAADLVAFVVALPGPIEWAASVPALVVLPGYALVSAAFPARPGDATAGSAASGFGPGWTARFGVAVAGSVVVVGVVGVALGAAGRLAPFPALVAVTGVTVAGAAVAAVRRARLAPARRANPFADVTVPVGGSVATPLQAATLVVALVALVGAVAFVGLNPAAGQGYSEAYLLTENESGDLVAAGYNTSYRSGQGNPLHVAIENHGAEARRYDVVVLAQRVGANGSVVASERVDRFATTVAAGERNVTERTVTPTIAGERVRLRFLVYEDGVPATPTASNADLSMRLWVDVDPR